MYTLSWNDGPVMLVGCGGTGGFVAEGLCRLLPRDTRLILVDPDRVEERNLLRQNFFREDLGKFKSEALAKRLARNFERAIQYSVFPYHADLLTACLVIGCVDNAAARRQIDQGGSFNWWLDSGNSRHSGQVLIGSRMSRFKPFEGKKVNDLPGPVEQLPSLLIPESKPSCAEDDGQSPVINQAMASLVLQFVYLLINNSLPYMAAYIDLEHGSLSYVDASPENVKRFMRAKV